MRPESKYPVQQKALYSSLDEIGECEGLCLDEIENPISYLEDVSLLHHEMVRLTTLSPLDDYHEDYGFVLWWKLPICEPPYSGSPLCEDWPGYHTHWSPCPQVREPPPASAMEAEGRDAQQLGTKSYSAVGGNAETPNPLPQNHHDRSGTGSEVKED